MKKNTILMDHGKHFFRTKLLNIIDIQSLVTITTSKHYSLVYKM